MWKRVGQGPISIGLLAHFYMWVGLGCASIGIYNGDGRRQRGATVDSRTEEKHGRQGRGEGTAGIGGGTA